MSQQQTAERKDMGNKGPDSAGEPSTSMCFGRREFLKGAAGVAGIGLLGMGGLAGLSGCASQQSDAKSGPVSYTPGTYQAQAEGKHGTIEMSVTFSKDRIDSIEVTSHSETEDISYIPLNVLPQVIIDTQSIDVDTVSGATLSSQAVIAGVTDAIKQAGANPNQLNHFDPQSIAQSMAPGTYTGEAYGKWKKGSIEGERFGCPATIEPTQVKVTVDETSIVSIEVASCSDTPGFFEPATERIPKDVVEQQSVFVDTVTGSTLTAAAITAATAKALAEAGASLAGFAKATNHEPKEESYEADLCIVGGGTAGSTAALKAVEEGLRVVVVEKTARISGEGSCATGALAVGSKLDAQVGNHVTVEEVFSNMMDYCYWKSDASLVYNVLDHSGEMIDWLQAHWDECGHKGFSAPKETSGTSIAHDYGKGTEKFQLLWDNYIIPGGATLLLNTKAEELIVENGTVRGISATKQDGTTVRISSPAVLVCTGGFGGNKSMQNEILGSSDFYLNGVATNTGDGISMCREVGAVLSTEVSPHLAEFCSNDVLDFYAGYMKFLNQTGFLMVDSAGARYMNETFCITHALARGASAMRRVGSSYIIFTQNDFDKLLNSGVHDILGEDIITEYKMRERILVPSYYTLQDEMDAALEHNQAWKADTLEELGELAGFDPSTYERTLADYQAVISSGEDTLFGKRPELLHRLDEGPFYAVRVISPIDGTFNGIKVNDHLQAIGEENKPSPAGLFVAGQDSGGYFSYPYTDYVGATCGYALTSGMMSIEYIKDYLGK
ncbi:FAD-dependent oxidoreductase [Raoultibacter massiliensis]